MAGPDSEVSGGVPEMKIERFCCDVAGEFCGAAEWRREKDTPKGSSGPSCYAVRRHRLGHAMLDFARRYTDAGALSPSKAAKVLGVKPRSVCPLRSFVKLISTLRSGRSPKLFWTRMAP